MRPIAYVLSMVILAGLLAACGGGSSKKSTPTATTSVGAATSTTASPTSSASVPTATTSSGSSTAATPSTSQPSGSAQPTATAPSQPAPPSPTAPSGPQTPGGGSTPPPSGFAYGFNVYWRGDEQAGDYNHKTIDAVKDAGFSWVRIQVQWSQLQPTKDSYDPLPLDRLVQSYEGSNVNILASVAKPPQWALDPSGAKFIANYPDFEGFMHFLAERYKGKIRAWEIWNEQNLAGEVGGEVNLDDYCHLLEAGYRGVKIADPNSLVVFGGLTPTGVNNVKVAIDDLSYLRAFYNYREGFFTKYFDIMGMHVSATNNPPDKMYPDDPGTGPWSDDPSFYFRRAEQLHQVMEEHGDSRPVWITEFGWTTANQAKGYEYGKDNSPQDQADYLVRAFEIARTQWPWTTGMFVWNLNFSTVTQESDEKFPWSVLNKDWSPRPAYEALKEMPKS